MKMPSLCDPKYDPGGTMGQPVVGEGGYGGEGRFHGHMGLGNTGTLSKLIYYSRIYLRNCMCKCFSEAALHCAVFRWGT